MGVGGVHVKVSCITNVSEVFKHIFPRSDNATGMRTIELKVASRFLFSQRAGDQTTSQSVGTCGIFC